MPLPPPTTTRQFEALFDQHSRAILGYALRRVKEPADAADVVSETFLVVWRRMDAVPHDGVRAWLYGVARRVLANSRRGDTRRDQLGDRLRQELAIALPPLEIDDRVGAVRAALATLADDDQEILRLAFWEELAPIDIATVLGIPDATARTRLHRARKRLREALEGPGPPAAPRTPAVTAHLSTFEETS
jgi:RNA polymerase sigma factor (sigma-70 family)